MNPPFSDVAFSFDCALKYVSPNAAGSFDRINHILYLPLRTHKISPSFWKPSCCR